MRGKSTLIDGKYEVLSKICEDNVSRVYKTRNRLSDKHYAIREIKTSNERLIDEVVAKNFVRESTKMKRLNHPVLPRVEDVVNKGNVIYVVMDYTEGRSLSAILHKQGPQAQEDVVKWGMDLCEALNYLHSQNPSIIYSDIKPENIILREDGSIRIIDFGSTREYKDMSTDDGIEATTVLGALGYSAPEQFCGVNQTDPRTDVYCLGATLFHLLTGISPAEPPYEMLPICQINPALSPKLEQVISKCIELDPDDRYQNCNELNFALKTCSEVTDVQQKKGSKSLLVFILALIAIILLSAGIILINTVL